MDKDDAFTGYHLRGMEDALRQLLLDTRWLAHKLDRLDRKIDALGNEMTPAERAALITTVNTETAEVSRVAAQLQAVAATMKTTAQE